VIVFLWDVRTPGGSARGITDDATRARLSASDLLLTPGATGRVERATVLSGGAWLTDGYNRLGSGWAARMRDGRVTWVAFRDPVKELDKAC
jgi:hypothetical protein